MSNTEVEKIDIRLQQLDCLEVRQSNFLRSYPTLGALQENEIAMVLTHDCSLFGWKIDEPYLEIIIGTPILKINPLNIRGRSPRKLDLELETESASKAFQLDVTRRAFVEKKHFHEMSAAESVRLKETDRKVVRNWLAGRYRAPAYPATFDAITRSIKENIKTAIRNCTVKDKFDLFQKIEGGSDEDPNYELRLSIIYAGALTEEEKEVLTQLASKIVKIFDDAKDKGIELVGNRVNVLAQNEVTLDVYLELQLLNYDYLSSDDTTEQPAVMTESSNVSQLLIWFRQLRTKAKDYFKQK